MSLLDRSEARLIDFDGNTFGVLGAWWLVVDQPPDTRRRLRRGARRGPDVLAGEGRRRWSAPGRLNTGEDSGKPADNRREMTQRADARGLQHGETDNRR
jgi:hypothetical protein